MDSIRISSVFDVVPPWALISALVGLWLLRFIAPPADLLALGLPTDLSSTAAVPAFLNFGLPSPTMTVAWLRLAWFYKIWPWRLERQKLRGSNDIAWEQEGPRKDDCVVVWGRAVVWREEEGCIPISALQKWSEVGDPLADSALEVMQKRRDWFNDDDTEAQKLLKLLHTADNSDDDDSIRLRTYADSLSQRPPRGAGAIPLAWYAARDARLGKSQPAWLKAETNTDHADLLDEEEVHHSASHEPIDARLLQEELAEERRLIKLGQETFYKYSGGILLSLLHFSLAGGFASPRLTSVLKKTAYLVPADRKTPLSEEKQREQDQKEGEKTWRRLIETTQWVLDVMESVDSMEPPDLTASQEAEDGAEPTFGGLGRHATLQVRFLHAKVRSRLGPRMPADEPLPLNQADMLATLLSFSAAPLASLARMGVTVSREEREAYLGVWRHVGWLMGVDARLIRRCLRDTAAADRALGSAIQNLFDADDLKEVRPPTYQILKSIASRPPFYTSFSLHCALASSLIGAELSDALGLPKPSLAIKAKVAVTYIGMWFTTFFGTYYPRRGWEQTRLRLSKLLLRRLMVWNLGMKRSSFRGHAAGDAGMTDVPRDDEQAKKEVREYQWMMREMIAVYVAAGASAVGLLYLMMAAA